MIKLFEADISGTVPYPETENLNLQDLNGLKTLGGYSLDGVFPSITIALRDGADVPKGLVDYFSVGLLHIVSSKLKTTLESVTTAIEYFPVSVLYQNKIIREQYYVANLLIRVHGIDLTKSDVDLDDEIGDALSVRKLILDEEKLANIEIAMIDEIQRIAVHPIVVEAILKSGCTGCMFVDPVTIRY
jgi:hypothetical protein